MTQLLTARELASLLSLKEQTIYNRHSTGASLPTAVKIGSRLRFRQSDVDAWIAGQIERQPATFTPSRGTAEVVQRARGRPTKAQQIAARKLDAKL
ncbi:helix-turn-helix transcriptional regulator [Massilia sp. DWR3-1-1]|uniref:helix-turn-helix transcriptional regulator n=1 Tax=Massilia sp. DWR3-1-1 TaxID=2804559 RepID=UPI003CF870FF